MGKVRRGIGRAAERVAAWSGDAGPWRDWHDDVHPDPMRRRRPPARFEDIDKFIAMLAVLERRVGTLQHLYGSNGVAERYESNPDAATPELRRELARSWIEEFASASNKAQAIDMAGTGGTEEAPFHWFIRLHSELTTVGVSYMGDRTAKQLTVMEQIVESHTTPMRRNRSVVIEPVRAPDAAQRQHDEDLAARINRAGLFWGGLAGILGGGVVSVIVVLIDAGQR